mgnify:FL=1
MYRKYYTSPQRFQNQILRTVILIVILVINVKADPHR